MTKLETITVKVSMPNGEWEDHKLEIKAQGQEDYTNTGAMSKPVVLKLMTDDV